MEETAVTGSTVQEGEAPEVRAVTDSPVAEVDANGLESTGNAPSWEAGPTRPYDFQQPSRISKAQQRSLRALYGLVTKGMEGWFAGRVRESISMELDSVDPLTFGEFTLGLPSPCASYILSLAEGDQTPAVIEIGRDFAFFIVDRLLGGGGALDTPVRPLTLVERAVVQIVVERLAHQLREAWHDYVPMDPRVVGFEAIPEMLQMTNPDDPVLVARVLVSVGDVASTVFICLPFPALEKFFSGVSGRRLTTPRGTPGERREEEGRLLEHIRRAGLTVSVHLPTFSVPLGVLSELKKGDFLATGFTPDAELEVRVAGVPRYTGRAGREGDQRAVRITDERSGVPGSLDH
ncbi:MAG: hypothetical protein EA421_14770 [Gemmatimonadales bacterium]|nr:MAG: hypothetical protein EA421_14770 [Gemmatimonadales bacterium]